MSPESQDNAVSPEEIRFNEQLRSMATEEGVPAGVISDEGFALAAALLERVRQQYGDPSKASYRELHNDEHALDVIRSSWKQWKPLQEALPHLFDDRGFELLMIAGAGHDNVYEDGASVGTNEEASAELTYTMMIEAGYGEAEAQRVYDAIIKTTASYDPATGSISQPKMRQGSKDVLGLILGRADMSGILIQGPRKLYGDTVALHHEQNKTQLRKGLSLLNPRGLVKALQDEKSFLRDRVEALKGDLEYHVEDEEEREVIIQVYKDNFGSVSLRALQLADNLHNAPERTLQLVEEAITFAGRTAHSGAERATSIRQYLIDQVKHEERDE